MPEPDDAHSTSRRGVRAQAPGGVAPAHGAADGAADGAEEGATRDNADALMRDIADELSDHLACAEMDATRRGASDAEATVNARRAFGDPRRVARELFILNGGVSMMVTRFMWFVLALVIVMFAAVMWHSQRQTAAMRTSLNELNERLTQLQAEPPTGTLILRVVSGPNHEPVENLKITVNFSPLKGWNPFSNPDSLSVKSKVFTTNAEGVIKLEPVDVGNYSYSIVQDPTNKGTHDNAMLSFAPHWSMSHHGNAQVMKNGEIVERICDISPPPMRAGTTLVPDEHEWSDGEKYFISLSFTAKGDDFRKYVSYSVNDAVMPTELPDGEWTQVTISYSFPEWYVRNLNQPRRDSVTYYAIVEKNDDGSLTLRPTTKWENKRATKTGT